MKEEKDGQFWSASIEDIKRGYIKSNEEFRCLICEASFVKGRIYPVGDALYEAEKAAELHVKDQHGSMLSYIINMNSVFTGLSQVQKELMSLFSEGISDKEIAEKLGIAASTVRNHRYKLREREKQAKLFLAMMELLAEGTHKRINHLDKDVICDAHKTATTVDDRFNISAEEKRKVLQTYMDEAGALKSYPAKEKKKIIVLEEIARSFKTGKVYSEKEVNTILNRIFEDNATLRRALIEYGFLARSKDCSEYWVKE